MKKFLFVLLTTTPLAFGASETCTDPHIDKQACLLEIRNVRGEKFAEPSVEEFRKNRLERCEVFAKEERELCINRVLKGKVQGKISEGGTITEYTETFVK